MDYDFTTPKGLEITLNDEKRRRAGKLEDKRTKKVERKRLTFL